MKCTPKNHKIDGKRPGEPLELTQERYRRLRAHQLVDPIDADESGEPDDAEHEEPDDDDDVNGLGFEDDEDDQ